MPETDRSGRVEEIIYFPLEETDEIETCISFMSCRSCIGSIVVRSMSSKELQDGEHVVKPGIEVLAQRKQDSESEATGGE